MRYKVGDTKIEQFLKGYFKIEVENEKELKDFYKLMINKGFNFFSNLDFYVTGFNSNNIFRYSSNNNKILSTDRYCYNGEKIIKYKDFVKPVEQYKGTINNNQATNTYKFDTDIIEYKGKKYDVTDSTGKGLIQNEKGIKPVDLTLHLKEHKEEILDEAEKRYLRNVIKYVIEPTHNKVKSIEKRHNLDWYYIRINYGIDDYSCLPEFTDKRMYKGMEIDKEYSLNELGLEE